MTQPSYEKTIQIVTGSFGFRDTNPLQKPISSRQFIARAKKSLRFKAAENCHRRRAPSFCTRRHQTEEIIHLFQLQSSSPAGLRMTISSTAVIFRVRHRHRHSHCSCQECRPS
jgi:hypothetical protein